MNSQWKIYALGSALFAGLTAIFAKLSVAELNPDLATLYRTVVICLICLLLVAVRGAWQPFSDLSVRGLVFLVLSGVATGLSWLCYFRALKLGPASGVAPLDKLSVVFVVLIAAALLGEKLTLKAGIGALLICGGAVLTAL
jgi:bacterial/archaeal transporter family protein